MDEYLSLFSKFFLDKYQNFESNYFDGQRLKIFHELDVLAT